MQIRGKDHAKWKFSIIFNMMSFRCILSAKYCRKYVRVIWVHLFMQISISFAYCDCQKAINTGNAHVLFP